MRAPTLTISLFLLVLQHVSTEGHWESKQLQVEATADSRQRVRERVKLLHAGIANLSRPGLDGFRELADAGPVLAHLTPLVRDVTDEEHWSSFLGTKNELNTAIVELNTAIVDLWATLDSAPTPNLNNSDYTAQEINAVIAWIKVYHEKFENADMKQLWSLARQLIERGNHSTAEVSNEKRDTFAKRCQYVSPYGKLLDINSLVNRNCAAENGCLVDLVRDAYQWRRAPMMEFVELVHKRVLSLAIMEGLCSAIDGSPEANSHAHIMEPLKEIAQGLPYHVERALESAWPEVILAQALQAISESDYVTRVDIDDDQQIENHKKGIEEQLLAASTASIIAEKLHFHFRHQLVTDNTEVSDGNQTLYQEIAENISKAVTERGLEKFHYHVLVTSAWPVHSRWWWPWSEQYSTFPSSGSFCSEPENCVFKLNHRMLNIVIVRINATDPNLQVEGTDQTTRDLLDVHFKDTINAMGDSLYTDNNLDKVMAEIRSSLVNGSSGECKEQPNNASSPCTSPPMYRAVIPVRFKAIGLPWPGSVYVPTPVGIVTGSWSGISYNPMIYGAHNSWFGHYNVKVFVYP